MKPFQFARIFLGSLLVLTLALPTLSPADAKNNPITCVFSNIAETHTLDPAIAFSSDGILFVRNVYEGLTEYEPGTAKVRPLLATGWEVDEEKMSFFDPILSNYRGGGNSGWVLRRVDLPPRPARGT